MTGLASIGTERKAKMANTGKGFRILSATLYTDKPLAMVREIVHNALDAHREVGKVDVPFLLHVPTAAEPWFAVRDFGPSIPDSKIDDVYLTYLQSTKQRHSNDVAGQLGLGSKAPLAVAESFNVATFIDGVKRVYTVFFDENDEVTVSPALSEPTAEPNGLEVRVEIPRTDVGQVQQKIATVLTYFDVLPTFSGQYLTIARPATALVGEGFAIRQETGYSYSGPRGPRAIMGGIVYPIDVSLVPDLSESDKLIFGLPIDITFPLGSLDFTPSRESLSYDKRRTLPALKTAAGRIRRAIKARIEQDFAKCDTELKARAKFGRMALPYNYSNPSRDAEILNAIGGKVAWRDLVIDTPAFKRSLTDYPGLIVTPFRKGRREGVVGKPITYGPLTLPPDTFEVIYNDRKKGSAAIARGEAKSNAYGKHENDVVLLYLEGPEAARTAFLASLPHLEVINPASHYVDDTPKRAKSNARRVYTNGHHGCSLDRKSLDRGFGTTIDLKDRTQKGFYVSLTRHEVEDARFTQAQWERAFDVSHRIGLFGIDDDVVAISSTETPRFAKSQTWVEFYPEAKRRAERFVKKANPWLARARNEAVEALELSYEWQRYLNKLVPTLAQEHPIRRFYETYTAWAQDYRAHARDAMTLVEAFNLPRVVVEADQDLGAALAAIRARYPLLTALVSHEQVVNCGYRESEDPVDAVEALAHPYIALIDGVAVTAVRAVEEKVSRKRAA